MKIREKIDINDLYFGVMICPMSYLSESDRQRLVEHNLFGSLRVKRSVAIYTKMTKEERRRVSDPLFFCFGDTWGRTEWEFIVCPWPYKDGETVESIGRKVDVYTMYVKPNAGLLMDLVNRVTASSARAFLREERGRLKR